MSDPSSTSTWIERVVLGVVAATGGVLGAWVLWLKAKLDAATARETKVLEVKSERADTTETHLLQAWKLERQHVLEERAALAAERVASRREREDADAARRAAQSDQAMALEQAQAAHACREELDRINGRLMLVEQAHATCPGQIEALRSEVERASRESTTRETRLAYVEQELRLARFARGDSERP